MAEVELPRYRLKAPSYMAPMPDASVRMLEAGAEITHTGKPSENMIPLNIAAEKMYALANIKPNSMRPELTLPLNGPGGGEAGAMLRQSLGFDEMIDQRFGALERQMEDVVARLARLEAATAKPAKEPPPVIPRAAVPPPPPPPAKAA